MSGDNFFNNGNDFFNYDVTAFELFEPINKVLYEIPEHEGKTLGTIHFLLFTPVFAAVAIASGVFLAVLAVLEWLYINFYKILYSAAFVAAWIGLGLLSAYGIREAFPYMADESLLMVQMVFGILGIPIIVTIVFCVGMYTAGKVNKKKA